MDCHCRNFIRRVHVSGIQSRVLETDYNFTDKSNIKYNDIKC